MRVGSIDEDRAAELLLAKGYTMIGRRVRVGALELDLIALDGEVVVFVEVRRRSGRHGTAGESISPSKLARIQQAASRYLAENGLLNSESRIDAVLFDASTVEHLIAVT